ncbi:hypothetical protein BDV19DRAFT_394322 [Aspergillus venezuelensis]
MELENWEINELLKTELQEHHSEAQGVPRPRRACWLTHYACATDTTNRRERQPERNPGDINKQRRVENHPPNLGEVELARQHLVAGPLTSSILNNALTLARKKWSPPTVEEITKHGLYIDQTLGTLTSIPQVEQTYAETVVGNTPASTPQRQPGPPQPFFTPINPPAPAMSQQALDQPGIVTNAGSKSLAEVNSGSMNQVRLNSPFDIDLSVHVIQ